MLHSAISIIYHHVRTLVEKLPFLFFLMVACMVLLFNSAFSPLLDFNPLPSANMFRTIGLGIYDGLVPYRDLFDTKGFLCFLLVGTFAKIFPGMFLGQWILSCCALAVTLWYWFLTARDIGECKRPMMASLLCMLPLLLGNELMADGGTSDEYVLPFTSGIFYYTLLTMKTEQISTTRLMLTGIYVSVIFWVKYTLCVAPAILCAGALVSLLKKNRLAAFKAGILWLAIFVIISSCIIGYYALNNALEYLYYGYYRFHVKNDLVTHGIMLRLWLVFHVQIVPTTGILTGVVILAFTGKKNKRLIAWHACIALAAQVIVIYLRSSIPYYLIPLIPYCIFSSCLILKPHDIYAKMTSVLFIVLVPISHSDLYPKAYGSVSSNFYDRWHRKKEVQAIAEYCKTKPEQTLIYYPTFDKGVHHYLGRHPHARNYQMVNYDYTGEGAQRNMIRQHKTRFVITLVNIVPSNWHYQFLNANGYKEVDKVFSPQPKLRLFELQEEK